MSAAGLPAVSRTVPCESASSPSRSGRGARTAMPSPNDLAFDRLTSDRLIVRGWPVNLPRAEVACHMRTLVYGRSLLTGRPDLPEIPDGGLIIDGAVITEVGSAAELRRRHAPDTELGGHDRVVLPGLVSAHQHGGGVSSVQLGCPDPPLERWVIQKLGHPPLDSVLDTLYQAPGLIAHRVTAPNPSHLTP